MAEQLTFGGDEEGSLDPTNAEPRCACLLVLDVSGSMAGQPIAELNAGLKTFRDALLSDELVMQRVEVSIITFGPVRIEIPFQGAESFTPPTLTAQGNTPMGAAILQAIDMIDQRKKDYRKNGLPYFRPWIFLITDGAPDSNDPWLEAAKAVSQGEKLKAFSFFAIGVQGANMETLRQISRDPVLLSGLKFRELFEWLSDSMGAVSLSTDGVEVQLPPRDDWASV